MDTSISYSDDGLIFAIYQGAHSITNILDLLKKFSTFTGLRISTAKSKIIPINFNFSKTDTDTLENYGLNSENFSNYFTFLGNYIYPNNLMKGARDKIELERGKMKNIIKSFENRGKGLPNKGRKIISNILLCSKLYHCTAAFPLKLKDFSGIQKTRRGRPR